MQIKTHVTPFGESRINTFSHTTTTTLFRDHPSQKNVLLLGALDVRALQMGATHPAWSSGGHFEKNYLYLAFVV